MEGLFKIIKLLVDSKRAGTWKLSHSCLVLGLILVITGFIGFCTNMFIRNNHGPLFLCILMFGCLLTIVFSIIVRFQSMSSHSRSAEEAGKKGEQHIAHQLAFLGDDYKVFNHVFVNIKGEQQEIDHIVVGPNGIFHIESKAYSGNLTFTSTGLSKDGQSIEDPTGQVYRHQFIMESILKNSGLNCDVAGVICFSNPNSTLNGCSPAFITCKVDRLIHLIKVDQSKTLLDSSSIKQIADCIERSIVNDNTKMK
ncbi:nuclease-related domain-containing protein [Paenibacillus sp. 1_12]|uniref:nuclease-related domain-containing protein n=1 Tax=Paenibacillus sp. 1_12 TaxID=1566278 RepID=UPI0015A68120|nr:nuclease-related domain-containing protein [Paenibacillus sp. 1_12]